jgi:hypothetical protein
MLAIPTSLFDNCITGASKQHAAQIMICDGSQFNHLPSFLPSCLPSSRRVCYWLHHIVVTYFICIKLAARAVVRVGISKAKKQIAVTLDYWMTS